MNDYQQFVQRKLEVMSNALVDLIRFAETHKVGGLLDLQEANWRLLNAATRVEE